MRLTDRQLQVLHILVEAWVGGKPMPTCREICEHLGFPSTNAATDHLKALEKKGAIRRPVKFRSRGIELVLQHPDVTRLRDQALKEKA